jgi:hypothetical protein
MRKQAKKYFKWNRNTTNLENHIMKKEMNLLKIYQIFGLLQYPFSSFWLLTFKLNFFFIFIYVEIKTNNSLIMTGPLSHAEGIRAILPLEDLSKFYM